MRFRTHEIFTLLPSFEWRSFFSHSHRTVLQPHALAWGFYMKIYSILTDQAITCGQGGAVVPTIISFLYSNHISLVANTHSFLRKTFTSSSITKSLIRISCLSAKSPYRLPIYITSASSIEKVDNNFFIMNHIEESVFSYSQSPNWFSSCSYQFLRV